MDRLDRIEGILEKVTYDSEKFQRDLEKINLTLDKASALQHEMAARQQYHDEAFERFDEWKRVFSEMMLEIQENSARDGEHIRALVRIAELHSQRLDGIEGGHAS